MTPAEFKRVRETLGMTKSQLAAALGLANARQIQRIENTGANITGPMSLAVQHLLSKHSERNKA